MRSWSRPPMSESSLHRQMPLTLTCIQDCKLNSTSGNTFVRVHNCSVFFSEIIERGNCSLWVITFVPARGYLFMTDTTCILFTCMSIPGDDGLPTFLGTRLSHIYIPALMCLWWMGPWDTELIDWLIDRSHTLTWVNYSLVLEYSNATPMLDHRFIMGAFNYLLLTRK